VQAANTVVDANAIAETRAAVRRIFFIYIPPIQLNLSLFYT